MSKPTLLLADADAQSLGILQLALRKAGFAVELAQEGARAIERALSFQLDLIVCDASLPGKDGFEVCRAVRAQKRLADLPIILLASDKSQKARAMEAGADDCVLRPVLLKDLVQRVQLQLDRRKLSDPGAPAALSGSIADLALLDVFQSLQSWKKSALVRCDRPGHSARVFVRDGEIIDAELHPLAGEAALYRLMSWNTGEFRVEFRSVHREPRIVSGTQNALLEALRRADELGRVSAEFPMSGVLCVDLAALAARLADLPDEVNAVVRVFDGKRTLREAMDLMPLDDGSAMAAVRRLIADGVLAPSEEEKGAIAARRPLLEEWLSTPPARADAPAAAGKVASPELVRFASVRGVRRKRLQIEAEAERARIAAGLPAAAPIEADPPRGRRWMSPAVGEAARKFAPDWPDASGAPPARSDVPAAPPADAPLELAAAAPSAPDLLSDIAPIISTTPPPARAALPRRRLWLAAAPLVLAIAWTLRPQPATDKKDAPWLEQKPAAPVALPAKVASATVAPPDAAAAAAYAKALQQGNALLERGKYRAAVSEYRAAVKLRPQSAQALLALGNAHLQADSPRSAVQPLEAAARLDAKSGRAQLLLGTTYQSLGRNADAAAAYRRYLDLEPAGDYVKDVKLILANLPR